VDRCGSGAKGSGEAVKIEIGRRRHGRAPSFWQPKAARCSFRDGVLDWQLGNLAMPLASPAVLP
jgi:hypothetical protein